MERPVELETALSVVVTLAFLCLFTMSIGFAMMFIDRIQMLRADAKDGKPWANDVDLVVLVYFGLLASIAMTIGIPIIYFLRVMPLFPLIN